MRVLHTISTLQVRQAFRTSTLSESISLRHSPLPRSRTTVLMHIQHMPSCFRLQTFLNFLMVSLQTVLSADGAELHVQPVTYSVHVTTGMRDILQSLQAVMTDHISLQVCVLHVGDSSHLLQLPGILQRSLGCRVYPDLTTSRSEVR